MSNPMNRKCLAKSFPKWEVTGHLFPGSLLSNWWFSLRLPVEAQLPAEGLELPNEWFRGGTHGRIRSDL